MLTSREASSNLHRFRHPLAGRYPLIDLTPALFSKAVRLANRQARRAHDAVPLAAAALEIRRERQDAGLSPLILLSADPSLNDIAAAEGQTVDDPRAHP